MSEELKVKALHMGPAECAVDLGDGSERGEYVDQDYILQKLGRPHRAVNLMYCYYPNDDKWPGRASVVHADPSVQFAWDFPYDDYFTYKGGLNGTLDDEPFTYMRDVRKHGQDVLLTMTIDPKLTDDHIIAIARIFARLDVYCFVSTMRRPVIGSPLINVLLMRKLQHSLHIAVRSFIVKLQTSRRSFVWMAVRS